MLKSGGLSGDESVVIQEKKFTAKPLERLKKNEALNEEMGERLRLAPKAEDAKKAYFFCR